jgi:hypothetical protein
MPAAVTSHPIRCSQSVISPLVRCSKVSADSRHVHAGTVSSGKRRYLVEGGNGEVAEGQCVSAADCVWGSSVFFFVQSIANSMQTHWPVNVTHRLMEAVMPVNE